MEQCANFTLCTLTKRQIGSKGLHVLEGRVVLPHVMQTPLSTSAHRLRLARAAQLPDLLPKFS